MATVCDLGRPEVAAACSFAAMLAGNVKAVKLITCTMVDQVRTPSIGLEQTLFAAALGVTGRLPSKGPWLCCGKGGRQYSSWPIQKRVKPRCGHGCPCRRLVSV